MGGLEGLDSAQSRAEAGRRGWVAVSSFPLTGERNVDEIVEADPSRRADDER